MLLLCVYLLFSTGRIIAFEFDGMIGRLSLHHVTCLLLFVNDLALRNSQVIIMLMVVMIFSVLAVWVLLLIHMTFGFVVHRWDHLAMPIDVLLLNEVVVGVAHFLLVVRLLIIFQDLDIGQRELTYLIVRVTDARWLALYKCIMFSS